MPDLTLDQARDAVAKAMGCMPNPAGWWHPFKKDWFRSFCPPTLDGAHEAIKAAGYEWARWGDGVWVAQKNGKIPMPEVLDTGDPVLDLWRLAALCWAEKGK